MTGSDIMASYGRTRNLATSYKQSIHGSLTPLINILSLFNEPMQYGTSSLPIMVEHT